MSVIGRPLWHHHHFRSYSSTISSPLIGWEPSHMTGSRVVPPASRVAPFCGQRSELKVGLLENQDGVWPLTWVSYTLEGCYDTIVPIGVSFFSHWLNMGDISKSDLFLTFVKFSIWNFFHIFLKICEHFLSPTFTIFGYMKIWRWSQCRKIPLANQIWVCKLGARTRHPSEVIPNRAPFRSISSRYWDSNFIFSHWLNMGTFQKVPFF